MKKPFWTIALKEFFTFINSAVAYVILVPFLVLNAFLFLRSALVMGDANLRPMIELLPWFLMIIGPALTMKAFSDERRKDTLELMYAHPVSEWTIVLAKYAGIMMFYGVMLAATLPLAISIAAFSTPDIGLMVCQYVGALLVGGVFIAIGVTAGAFIPSAIGGFLAGAAVNFMLVLLGMGFVTLMFPGPISRIINDISITPHVTSVSRGVIDFRDMLYFGSLIGTVLALTVLKLSERKVAEMPAERRKLWLVVGLVVMIGVIGNVVVYEYPIRLDLTRDHRYSLSPGTRQLLASLPDRVNLTLYTSNNLPGPMQVTLQETSDWLKDFKRYGKKIVLRTVQTDASPENKNLAVQHGMREVQFNQIGTSSFQVQTGFLGLEAQYGAKTETIDFVSDSSNLEYQLGRMLVKLTQTKVAKVGFLTGGDAATEQLSALLYSQYQIAPLSSLSKDTDLIGLAGVVVVDDGKTAAASEAALIKNYLTNGGNVLAFIDGMSVDAQTLQPVKTQSELIKVLADWGISIKSNLAYDVQLNEPVTLGGGTVRYVMPYPYWLRALIQKASLPSSGSQSNVLLGWASTMDITNVNGFQYSPLLTTGNQTGGVIENPTTVNPSLMKTQLTPNGKQLMGVVGTKDNQRLIVVADTEIVSDNFLTNSAENQAFAANTVDYIAADAILNQIPKRTSSRNVFTFNSPAQVKFVQYGNIAGPSVIAAFIGGWWLMRRRKLTRRIWQQGDNS